MSERRGFGDFVDRLTSVAAIITAVAAVAIAVYEAHITRDYQRKSVWPYVMQYHSYAGRGYTQSVENVGLSPALVHSFEIRVGDSTYSDGTYASWSHVVRALTGAGKTDFTVGEIMNGSVLKAGHRLDLLQIGDPARAAKFLQHLPEMHTVICYCSLYGECWRANSDSLRPRPVARCPTPSR